MVKTLFKQIARRAGIEVRRVGAPNRFQAMEHVLDALRGSGYRPSVVLDVGANVGGWFRLAAARFPDADYHLVEPQPACGPALRQLVEVHPRVRLHEIALTAEDVADVRMVVGDATKVTTGAYVGGPGPDETATVTCAASTLDRLAAEVLKGQTNALLKLDVEGHEGSVLQGGLRALRHVEVVISEVSFYRIGGDERPLMTDLSVLLNREGFDLFDFASLSSRRRDGRLRMGDSVFVRRESELGGGLALE